ncbi:hypothetical protein DRO66_05230 [Candidatus Bathyarchaeota archaeon]|nr:MAG: hypothetical protein DRO66_05230 [Candidatus Bathyarchaeota archaeon]
MHHGRACVDEGEKGDVRRRFIRETLLKVNLSIDYACSALTRREERAFDDYIWKTAFYLEYLTFLLSLSRTNVDDVWKKREKLKRGVDLTIILSLVQDSLKEAEKDDSVDDMYRKVWIARGRILSIQRRLNNAKAKKFLT